MDLRAYYQKIRDVEKSLKGADAVVVSLSTPDGGKEGVATEVPRAIAARMVVEGSARLATAEETKTFLERTAEAKRAADQAAAATRMQVTVVPTAEWRNLRNASRGGRE